MFFARCTALALAGALTLAAVARASAGVNPFSLGNAPPPPPPPELDTGAFDVPRKPPIPVSFLSHDGGWITFQYPPSARDRVAGIVAQADELRAELTEALGQTPLEGVEVRVARGAEEMSTLAPSGGVIDSQAVSITYPQVRLIVLSLGGADPADLAAGFRLELARLALFEAVGGRALPRWFSDGFATRFERDGEWGREWQLYRAVLRQRTHTTAELDRAFEKGGAQRALASAESTDFFAYLLQGDKTARFAAAVERLRQGDDAASALGIGYGSDISALEREWRSELGRRATFTTILGVVGVPAVALLTYALLRARRRRAAAVKVKGRKSRVKAGGEPQRVHIVLSRREGREERAVPIDPSMISSDADVPKVEHEGEWHTLH
ncbi:MAG: hypothetical protein ABW133_20135 [Polyangiaceae bacterium]